MLIQRIVKEGCAGGATDLRGARQLRVAVLADALALHAAGAERAVRAVRGVLVAVHALAHAAEVALHQVLHVAEAVQAELAVAARVAAAPAVHARRRLRHVLLCAAWGFQGFNGGMRVVNVAKMQSWASCS